MFVDEQCALLYGWSLMYTQSVMANSTSPRLAFAAVFSLVWTSSPSTFHHDSFERTSTASTITAPTTYDTYGRTGPPYTTL